jgi:hypothetical protein
MGTRADFYIGKGKDAEWIGSIAWDGYRDGIDNQILHCQSPEAFRHAVESFLKERDDGIFPKDGWPWPWKDSGTTDCSYWFFDGQVWDEYDGRYVPISRAYPEDDEGIDTFADDCEAIDFPDLSGQYNGGSAGFIVITAVR